MHAPPYSTFLAAALALAAGLAAPAARAMTPDEMFRYVDLDAPQLAPDGRSLLCALRTRDFDKDRLASWIWRVDLEGDSARPVQLTRSGDDYQPRWSPDGRTLAFLRNSESNGAQLYLMDARGGEPRALTHVEGDLHDFAFAPDGRGIYFSLAYEAAADSADSLPDVGDAVRYDHDARATELDRVDLGSGQVTTLARLPYEVSQLAVSPDGAHIAFATFTPEGLEENVADAEVWVMGADGSAPHALTHNQVDEEQELQWSEDGRGLYYVATGDENAPRNIITQARLYRVELDGGPPRWLTRGFPGSVGCYLLGGPSYLPPGGGRPALVTAQQGLDAPPARLEEATGRLLPLAFPHGLTWGYAAAPASPRVAFLRSDIRQPPEVWVAESREKLGEARCVTRFNAAFAAGVIPVTTDWRFRAPDGRPIEALLTWPPGQEHARNLPLLVDLHGGPEFFVGHYCMPGYDQYRVASAPRGFLVFEPNYRGSYGYGDDFHTALVGHPVSKPAEDVLAGVEELIRTGLADPARVSVTGYSFGGYLCNYLITHSRRFRAAATGAGAANHSSTWGNHDLGVWGEYLFGGNPFQQRARYESESPFWRLPQVTTATHIVAGEDDTTVPAEEAYQLYRGLRLSSAPVSLLIFPGEGHTFTRPTHERAKVVSELYWLERYGLRPAAKP
ncbi:MAG TPA: prolyl oligopeptidase family serine peptidase [Candidatus Saccharimonadales bacterium]|nr:prolyl oligopeptidase family serine peptidase [Candidatus Saccharimonadales bacterium]